MTEPEQPAHDDACTCPICVSVQHLLQEMVDLDHETRIQVLEICLLRAHASVSGGDAFFVLSGLALSLSRMIDCVRINADAGSDPSEDPEE
jgi:hypothetical protein